jgi:hypothetical protein
VGRVIDLLAEQVRGRLGDLLAAEFGHDAAQRRPRSPPAASASCFATTSTATTSSIPTARWRPRCGWTRRRAGCRSNGS